MSKYQKLIKREIFNRRHQDVVMYKSNERLHLYRLKPTLFLLLRRTYDENMLLVFITYFEAYLARLTTNDDASTNSVLVVLLKISSL